MISQSLLHLNNFHLLVLQIGGQLLPVFHQTLLIIFFLSELSVFLFNFVFGNLNTLLQVFRAFHTLDPVSLFVLLLLDEVKLSLHLLLSGILLGSCTLFEQVRISEGIPLRSVGIQDIADR